MTNILNLFLFLIAIWAAFLFFASDFSYFNITFGGDQEELDQCKIFEYGFYYKGNILFSVKRSQRGLLIVNVTFSK